jgi:hypothetical protein
MVASSSGGKNLGKVVGSPSFVKVVRLSTTVFVKDSGPLVYSAEVVWCEVEKILLLGLEQETVRQAVDCFTMERSSSGPLCKDLHADGSRFRNCRGCRLACSKYRVVEGVIEFEVDVSA